MLEDLTSYAQDSWFNRLKQDKAYCPKCGTILKLPTEMPSQRMEHELACSGCGWLGSLNALSMVDFSERVIQQQPSGSAIVKQDFGHKREWTILPTKKFNILFIGAIIWLSFIALVTVLLAFKGFSETDKSGNVLLGILVLTLFWITGGGYLYLWLRTQFTTVTISVDGSQVSIKRSLMGREWTKYMVRSEVENVFLKHHYSRKNVPVYNLCIQSKNGRNLSLYSGLTDDEKSWMIYELKQTLAISDESSREKLASQSRDEIQTKHISLTAIDDDIFQITSRSNHALSALVVGILLIVVMIISLMIELQITKGISSFIPAMAKFSGVVSWFGTVVFFLTIIILFTYAFWSWKRVTTFTFNPDEVIVDTSWRGNETRVNYSKEDLTDVTRGHSGGTPKNPQCSVTLFGKKKLKICSSVDKSTAETLEAWLARWLA